jgi:trans-2-enoyl-CoA reductase
VVILKAMPDSLQNLLSAASSSGAAVVSSASKSKGAYTVALLDLDQKTTQLEDKLKAVEGVVRVRIL